MKYLLLAFILMAFPLQAHAENLTGVYTTSFESGMVPSEDTGETCNEPYKIIGDICAEPYTATNTLGLFDDGKGTLDFAAELSFFNGHTCSVAGTARKIPLGWIFQKSETSGQNCRLVINRTDSAITFTVPQGYDCSFYCGARGNLGNAEFPLSSKIKYTPTNKDELKCITGEGACKWQNDKGAKQ